MNRTGSRDGAAGTVVGIAAVLTGGGALTFALFPFLLPTVVLLAALALPLAPLALAAVALYGLTRAGASLVARVRHAPTRDRRVASRRAFGAQAAPR